MNYRHSWGCNYERLNKRFFAYSLLCSFALLLPFYSSAQYTFVNDQILTFAPGGTDSIVSSCMCVNESNKTLIVTNQLDRTTRLPFATITIFDDDFVLQKQTALIDASSSIQKNGSLVIYDVSRVSKGLSDCSSGYILAGTVSLKDVSCGILIAVDDTGKYIASKYYPSVTEIRGVAIANDGFIAVGDSIAKNSKNVGLIFKTDCNLNVMWCRQVCNYTGDAYCYAQYTGGGTDLKAVKSIGAGRYIVAGTASWMITPSRIGDKNIVLCSFDAKGNMLWSNSYGYAGTGTRYEESTVGIAIDTSRKDRSQIVVLGKSVYDTTSACSDDSIPAFASNLLFTTDFDGNVFWAKEVPQADNTDDLRVFTYIASGGDQLMIAADARVHGRTYSLPAIYRFDRMGAFIGGRIYDDGILSYKLPANGGGGRISNDIFFNSEMVGNLNTGEIFTIQSYPSISSGCDMTKENAGGNNRAMPSIGLPQKVQKALGVSIKLANTKDKWELKVHCAKKKE